MVLSSKCLEDRQACNHQGVPDAHGTTQRPRVGVVGFFGWGNFGDELFLRAHQTFLGARFEVTLLHDMLQKPYFSRPPQDVVEDVDAVVIGGGDLVIPWQLSDLYWERSFLERPVFFVGLGVPRWGGYSRDVVGRMREFVQHENVCFIGARDPESRDWIAKHLQPRVPVHFGPDLVCALDFPAVEEPTTEPVLGVVTRKRRGEPDNYEWLVRLCERAEDNGYRIRHLVLGTGEVGAGDESVASELSTPRKTLVRSEDLMELCTEIGRCTVLASMKFHGTVVAAMYGVPSLVLSATDKSRNFLRMIERPELLSGLNDPRLPDRFSPYMARIPMHTRRWLKEEATRTIELLIGEMDAVLHSVPSHR